MLVLRVDADAVSIHYGVTFFKDFFNKNIFLHKMENNSDGKKKTKSGALDCSRTDVSKVNCLLPRDYPLKHCYHSLPFLSTIP